MKRTGLSTSGSSQGLSPFGAVHLGPSWLRSGLRAVLWSGLVIDREGQWFGSLVQEKED